MTIREAELAGAWYPATPAGCQAECAAFRARRAEPQTLDLVYGAIAPHAGWIYSGAVAYSALSALGGQLDTLVLFAGHLSVRAPLSVLTRGLYATPCGAIPTDEALAGELAEALDAQEESPTRHSQDNSTEVLLPMLKQLHPSAQLVVVGTPPRYDDALAAGQAAAALATRLGRRIGVVGSTDLTHYGASYGLTHMGTAAQATKWAREVNDAAFLRALAEMRSSDALDHARSTHSACCPGAAVAALECARSLGARHGEILSYAQSYDLRPADSFVGYGAVVFGLGDVRGTASARGPASPV